MEKQKVSPLPTWKNVINFLVFWTATVISWIYVISPTWFGWAVIPYSDGVDKDEFFARLLFAASCLIVGWIFLIISRLILKLFK
jgi:hypothetical protein